MNKIETCKTCTKRKFDPKQGILCKLTDAKPAFEESCRDYEKDEEVQFAENNVIDIRPNEKRAKQAITMIWIILGAQFISLMSSGLQYNMLKIAESGGYISEEAANANDLRELTISIVLILLRIISAVTFIMWFRRAYYNLHQRVPNLSFDEGWAAGAWFVPIINLFRPLQIMQELYDETIKLFKKAGEDWSHGLKTSLVGVWWTLWIISAVFAQVVFRMAKNANTLPELKTSTTLDIVAILISIPLALITISMIKNYSRVESMISK